MKRLLLVLLIIFALIALSACLQKSREANHMNDNNKVIDFHTEKNSLDYTGTYTGILPATGGESVQTTLRLRTNQTYILQHTYADPPDYQFEEKGVYTVKGNLLTLTNSKNTAHCFRIGENQLFFLNKDQKAESKDYILTK